jgi:hypothetical protein
MGRRVPLENRHTIACLSLQLVAFARFPGGNQSTPRPITPHAVIAEIKHFPKSKTPSGKGLLEMQSNDCEPRGIFEARRKS